MCLKSFIALTALIMTVFMNPCISSSQVKRSGAAVDADFPLPDKVALCGEPMPLNDQWTWEMLDREITITAWNKEQTFMYLKRAGRYFPYLEKKLAQNNMPDDLKYLVVAESALLPHAKSTQGAVGLWQFMAETAKKYGLKSDKYVDERRGLEESTDAALAYLKRLKEIFGSWSLAMAAYNCGENRVKQEIKDQQEKDFYSLKLPAETERYIFRVAAIKIVMENPQSYGYRVPETRIYSPVKCDTVKVNLKKPMHITEFAKAIGTTFKAMRNLNPQLIDDYLPAGAYSLNIPVGTAAKAQETLKAHSSKSFPRSDEESSGHYIVQEGDTLTGISRKTGVPLDRLIEINGLKGSIIKAGDKLSLE